LKIASSDSHWQLLMDRIETPIGEMVIVADHDGNLRATFWTDREAQLHDALRRQYGQNGFTLDPACNPHGLTNAIGRYFAGELTAIDSAKCGVRYEKSSAAPHYLTGNLPRESAGQTRSELLDWPMVRTRWELSCPATA
jgi:hypothetical protein